MKFKPCPTWGVFTMNNGITPIDWDAVDFNLFVEKNRNNVNWLKFKDEKTGEEGYGWEIKKSVYPDLYEKTLLMFKCEKENKEFPKEDYWKGPI